jgi:hypothetical protein
LNHPVHKLVCIAGAADRGAEGVAGDGDLIAILPANAGIPDLGETSDIACLRQLGGDSH